jgi:hypothetical protein
VLLKQAAEKEREQEKEKENIKRQLRLVMEIDPKGRRMESQLSYSSRLLLPASWHLLLFDHMPERIICSLSFIM